MELKHIYLSLALLSSVTLTYAVDIIESFIISVMTISPSLMTAMASHLSVQDQAQLKALQNAYSQAWNKLNNLPALKVARSNVEIILSKDPAVQQAQNALDNAERALAKFIHMTAMALHLSIQEQAQLQALQNAYSQAWNKLNNLPALKVARNKAEIILSKDPAVQQARDAADDANKAVEAFRKAHNIGTQGPTMFMQ